MKKILLFVAVLVLGCVAYPHRSPAPLVIKPGEDANYVPPGGEEIPNQKDAQAQFDAALEAEKRGKISAAITGYKKTVRRFPEVHGGCRGAVQGRLPVGKAAKPGWPLPTPTNG